MGLGYSPEDQANGLDRQQASDVHPEVVKGSWRAGIDEGEVLVEGYHLVRGCVRCMGWGRRRVGNLQEALESCNSQGLERPLCMDWGRRPFDTDSVMELSNVADMDQGKQPCRD